MDDHVFNAQNRYRIIQYALKTKNVSKTCELFGISRTIYYRWLARYRKSGMEGIENKTPGKPRMPNKVNRETEKAILAHVIKFPADGPKRISCELESDGYFVGITGIYNVLKRNSLNTRSAREAYAGENRQKRTGHLDAGRLDYRLRNRENAKPGYLVLQSLHYAGRFDGIGKVYQYSIYDTWSRWGLAKLYHSRSSIRVQEFIEQRIVPLMKTFHITIDNLVTHKTPDFAECWEGAGPGNRYFRNRIELEPHSGISVRRIHEIVKPMEEFQRVLYGEFFVKFLAEGKPAGFKQLEEAFEKYLRHYNFARPVANGANKGMLPADVVLQYAAMTTLDMDSLPLWLFTRLED